MKSLRKESIMCFRTKVSLILLALFIGAGVFSMNVQPVQAASLAELQQIIEQLKIQIAELQERLEAIEQGKEDPVEWCHDFNVNLKYGDKGAEVEALQMALTKEGFYNDYSSQQDPSKAYFDERVASAVVGFQEKYAKDILAQWGLKHGTGFVGKSTRAKLNKLYGCEQEPEPEPEPSITIISPNGGEKWAIGSTHIIRWTSDTESSRVVIDILDEQGKCADTENGLPAVVANNEAIEWVIPTNFSSGQYKMRVMICPVSMPSQECANIDLKQYGFDESDDYFSIIAAEELTCDDQCKAKGYDKGICRSWAVVPSAEWGCRTGELDIGRTSDCTLPEGLVGVDKTCCCQKETGENLPPVIDGITAPTQLRVNEKGVWTIQARDPENGALSYSVNWGDEYKIALPESAPAELDTKTQTTTFTHSYSQVGTYTIRFTVTDDKQQTAKTSTTVKIGGSEIVCTDSDGGINKYVKGRTCRDLYTLDSSSSDSTKTSSFGRFCRTDRCMPLPDGGYSHESGTSTQAYLTEYYCSNNRIFSKTLYCENGCEDGACKREVVEPTCTDTDHGRDYYKRGGISDGIRLPIPDYCVKDMSSDLAKEKKLNEYYCYDNKINSEIFECPNGCIDGACIIGDEPYCSAIGSKSEGWYENGERIIWDNCDGCYAICMYPDTDYEGWYSSCDTVDSINSIHSEDRLIKYDECGSIEPQCTVGEKTEFTCPDGTKVPSCECGDDGIWSCVNSPETGCPGFQCFPNTKEYHTCPDGTEVLSCECQDDYTWECINSPESQCPSASGCTDTDKGIKEYVKGTACKALVVDGEDTMFCRTDRCIPLPDSYIGTDMRGYLTEYYCKDEKIFSKTIHCENGCADGACKGEQEQQEQQEKECHTSNLWSWDYCSPGCKCSAGEGDCDTDADCATGYCAKNVGVNYGQDSKIDICEEKQE